MGGRDDTLNEPAYKSLLDTLAKNARDQLASKGIPVKDTTPFEDALFPLAAWYFLDAFGYSYSNNPDECHPLHLDGTNKVTPIAKLCSIKTSDISAGNIERYIKTTMMAQAKVPQGIQDRALQDLINFVKALMGQPFNTTNAWRHDTYLRTFEPTAEEQELKGVQNAVQVDGILVLCNTQIQWGSNNIQLCVIYYMGAYYEVPSQMTKMRNEFQENAFKETQPFTGSAYPIKSESDLERALQTYANTLFKTRFGYNYWDRPPSMVKTFSPTAVDRQFLLRSSYETRFKQEGWLTALARTYLQSFNFRDSDMRESANRDLGGDLVNFAQKQNTATWSIQYFDRMYDDPSQPRLNASRLTGLILYFCKRGTTDQDYDVWVTFVSILGIFHEIMPIQQTIMGDLLADLCRILPNQDRIAYIFNQCDTRTLAGLHALTLECATIDFRKAFLIDWSRTNTVVAQPDEVLEAYEVLFDLNTDLSAGAISNAVSINVVKPDGLIGSTVVPEAIVKDIYDDLVERIGSMANGVTTLQEANQWHSETLKRSFGSGDSIITQYAVFLYAFGEQSAQSINVQQFYLQYLSVFVQAYTVTKKIT